jgi:hypothetical protein
MCLDGFWRFEKEDEKEPGRFSSETCMKDQTTTKQEEIHVAENRRQKGIRRKNRSFRARLLLETFFFSPPSPSIPIIRSPDFYFLIVVATTEAGVVLSVFFRL